MGAFEYRQAQEIRDALARQGVTENNAWLD